LAILGLAENVYILGGQITEVKDDIKDIRGDIKTLVALQTKLERRDLSLAEKALTNCGKKR